MQKSDFVRIFQLRAPRLMWLLGAGASASAGLPTAGQMIWRFKQQLYCAEQRVTIKSCPDLNDPTFQSRLNRYFQQKGGYPAPWSDREYSFYFEQAYPTEKDRHLFIDHMVTGATPSHGHLALASLAKLGLLTAIWTTNFDRLPEDAVAKVFGSTGSYAVATLNNPQLAEQALSEGRRPVIIKLHGDFQSRELKNIEEELRSQDARLRRALMIECQRQGLAVVGFSGRDDSVMEMLEEAVQGEHSYPGGLFWFHRPDGAPCDRVQRLIAGARAKKVDAHLVETETFDELMLDLFLLMENVPEEIKAVFAQQRKRLTYVNVPDPARSDAFPFIRLNALPLSTVPATCRSVECKPGKTSDIRDAIIEAGVNVVAMKRLDFIICFGSDADVQKAFERFGISKLDLYAIQPRRLKFDSAELGLLNEALAKALARERPLGATPMRGGWKLYVLPEHANDASVAKLRQAAGGLSGVIPGTDIRWAEAIRVRIERKLDRNWLLFEPSVWVDYPAMPDDADEAEPIKRPLREQTSPVLEFIRERAANTTALVSLNVPAFGRVRPSSDTEVAHDSRGGCGVGAGVHAVSGRVLALLPDKAYVQAL